LIDINYIRESMKMKVLTILLILLLSTIAPAQQSSWQNISPIPQGNTINALSVIDANTIFACGANGTFMNSTNGGESWYIDNSLGSEYNQFYSLYFVTNQVGWLGGEAGTVMRTTNGGRTWTLLDLPSYEDIYCMYFSSTTVGWVTGSSGTVLKTTDGGNTWSTQASGTTSALLAMTFLDSQKGWIVGGNGSIIRTTDGGTSWNTQSVGISTQFTSVSFSDASKGWVTDYSGRVFRTTNGGDVWSLQTDTVGLTLTGIQFLSSTVGFAAGSFGTVIKTTDGGNTWIFQYADTYKDFYAMRFASTTTGWAVGDYGTIFKTTNGGTTWIRKSGVTRTDLYASYWPSISVGYMVGAEGTVLRTSDGGYTWENRDEDSVWYDLYGVTFVNDNIGWVIGDYGLIFKTINGGLTWTRQKVGELEDPFYSVFFLDASKGWVSGDYGDILKTTNGGSSWIQETTNVFASLQKVKFCNANTGWAVGDGGTIIKSTDGGITWTEQGIGVASGLMLYSIDIIDQNTVYVSGDFGTILTTNDGGAHWYVVQAPDIIESLYDIATFTTQHIWTVGDDGLIYGTNNGGTTWERMLSNTMNTLQNIQAIPASLGATIIASGIGNTVLKSSISPFTICRWTGASDSLWSNSANWSVNRVPNVYDSVYIPVTSRRPTIRPAVQRINIAALTVATGASLFVGSGVSEFVVSGGILLDGTLEMEANTRTDIIAGGGFVINNGTFNQGIATCILNGGGELKGTFNTLTVLAGSTVRSAGNITIQNWINTNSTITMRSSDTLFITTTDSAAILGLGVFEGGTVKRAIAPASTAVYRFESPATSVQFYPDGTLPSYMLMTAFPKYLNPEMPESIYVKRYYVCKAIGGSDYISKVFLRYSETESSLYPDQVGFYIDSSGHMINLGNSDYEDGDYMATALDSVRAFTTWYLGDVMYYPKLPMEFSASLTIADNGSVTDSLQFGAMKGATTGIDTLFYETALGPKPAVGTYDIRWVLPSAEESKTDIRPFAEGEIPRNTYVGEFQPGAGGYPVTLSWNLYTTALGTLYLQDEATHGSKFSVNMRTQSSLTISDTSIKRFQIVQNAPYYVSVLPSWNMISIPVTLVTSNRKSYVFPIAISQAFRYSNGYLSSDTLANGKGYWLKFYQGHQIGLEGFERTIDSFAVSSGWNMIGSIASKVKTSSIGQSPSGIVAGFYYGYASGYSPTDTIVPGKGYWIKTSNNGKLILASTTVAKEKEQYTFPDLEEMPHLVVQDKNGGKQNLYFGDVSTLNVPIEWFEMPPTMPGGAFDARFSSNRMVEPIDTREGGQMTVSIQSENYPVILRCAGPASDGSSILVTDAGRGTPLGMLTVGGNTALTISNPAITKVRFTVKSGTTLPRVFSLEQNYPNPFNPSTSIQFAVPEQAVLTLQVFNLLGQQVATLLDQTAYEPGNHVVNWNASNLSSGIYFYRLVATRPDGNGILFQQVKKLMMVK